MSTNNDNLKDETQAPSNVKYFHLGNKKFHEISIKYYVWAFVATAVLAKLPELITGFIYGYSNIYYSPNWLIGLAAKSKALWYLSLFLLVLRLSTIVTAMQKERGNQL